MSNLLLPTSITGAIIDRYPEHDQAITALCRLRDRYPVGSPEYLALNANSETINRLGGRVDSILIEDHRTKVEKVIMGYEACVWYMKLDGRDRQE